MTEVLGSPGHALDASSRAYFEPRFGRDLAGVRIHSDARAAASARSVNALAYTSGQHIAFAAGAYAPTSAAGRRLLAHELTHTVQQSSAPLLATAGAGVVQRQPQRWEPRLSSGPGSQFFTTPRSNDTEAYFGRATDVCRTCHQPSEEGHFQVHKVQHAQVTESKIREWAATEAWGEAIISGRSLTRKQLFSLLLRREDKKLDTVWESYREPTVAKVRPSLHEDLARPIISGSDAARNYWADYVEASWSAIVADLDQRALDWLTRDIDETLHTPAIPAGATLVTDPARVATIEDRPGRERIDLGRWNDTATVGFTWVGKRIRSADTYRLDFEVVGHEGIYFELSVSDFLKTDPFVGKVAGDVAAGTKGIVMIGAFIKGALTAAASPVTMALDTAAKVIDMGTQGISALGKWRGWYDIGYTCLSSTCKQYEQCIKAGERAEDCSSDALKEALAEATVIIPIYRQGRECLAGDAEACGGIAVLALGLVKGEGGPPLAKAEFEQAAIRSAIDRPHAGDPHFTKALEPLERTKKLDDTKPAAKTGTEPRPHKEPPGGRKTEPAARPAPSEAAIEGFATAADISSTQLKAELAELRRSARDATKVRRPTDPRFDAEIATSANGEPHTYDRERPAPGHESEPVSWCRFSPAPGACGAPVHPEVDRWVDEAIEAIQRKTTGKKPPPPKETTLTAAEYRKRKAAAQKAFKFGDKPSQIGAEVGRHRDAPATREAEGLSGRHVQSAHDAPSSFMKSLDDYSRDNAITMLLDRPRHRSFDQIWKDWAQDQRRLGHAEVSVDELRWVMEDAIERAPITDAQKSALHTLLLDELTQKHGLGPAAKLDLPYSNIPALKPGPERAALTARIAAEQKSRASSRAASAAREKARIANTIATYDRLAKSLERSGNKGRAQVYRLEIEKLKRRQKK